MLGNDSPVLHLLTSSIGVGAVGEWLVGDRGKNSRLLQPCLAGSMAMRRPRRRGVQLSSPAGPIVRSPSASASLPRTDAHRTGRHYTRVDFRDSRIARTRCRYNRSIWQIIVYYGIVMRRSVRLRRSVVAWGLGSDEVKVRSVPRHGHGSWGRTGCFRAVSHLREELMDRLLTARELQEISQSGSHHHLPNAGRRRPAWH